MDGTNVCPQCGAQLTADALLGLCAQCLLQQGLKVSLTGAADQGTGAHHQQNFTPPTPQDLAHLFPQLEILELLGQGGMGAVYKARQKKLDRLVALKIIRPEAAHDVAFAERFNREARTLARLNHPAIVGVHDFGEVYGNITDDQSSDSQPPVPDGKDDVVIAAAQPTLRKSSSDATSLKNGDGTLYYFLMEYVDGANLRQLMEDDRLPPGLALSLVNQICDALQFAHSAGVVHRDIKPENILVDLNGQVRIADFGLAKITRVSPDNFTLTDTHQVMGTPRYMAPEQMDGSHGVDHRADIYSLGVVFYEMLTGQIPAGHFEPPSRKVEVDVRLDEVVLRALAREPDQRYQQVSDVRSDVEAVASTSACGPGFSGNRGSSNSEDARRSRRRWLAGTILSLVICSALVVVAGKLGWLPPSVTRLFGDPYGRSPLVTAAINGEVESVTTMLQSGEDPDEQSPLFWAAGLGHEDVVRQLLNAGASVDQPFRFGITPLMLTAATGRLSVAEMLIEAGANVNARGDEIRGHGYIILGEGNGRSLDYSWPGPKMTPLLLAVEEGHVDLVKLLLASGADPDSRDARGRTAAEIAKNHNHDQLIEILSRFDVSDD